MQAERDPAGVVTLGIAFGPPRGAKYLEPLSVHEVFGHSLAVCAKLQETFGQEICIFMSACF